MISVIFWFVSLLEKCWEVVATVATWWPSVVTSKAAQTLSQPRRSRFAGHALWPTSIPEAQLVESSWPSPCQSESTHDRRFGRSIGWQLHQMVSWKSWRRPLQRGTFPYFSLPRSPGGKKSTVTHPATTPIGPVPAILVRSWMCYRASSSMQSRWWFRTCVEGLSKIRVPWYT